MAANNAQALYYFGEFMQKQFGEIDFRMTGDPDDPNLSVMVRFLPVEMWELDFKGGGGSLRLTKYDTTNGLEQARRKSAQDLYLTADRYVELSVLLHEILIRSYDELVDSGELADHQASNEMARRGAVATQKSYDKAMKRATRKSWF